MSIIDAAGLTQNEAEAFVAPWASPSAYSKPSCVAYAKLAEAIREELRPAGVGDRVKLPWPPNETFTVHGIHDGWAFCFPDDDSPPTVLRLDAVERVR